MLNLSTSLKPYLLSGAKLPDTAKAMALFGWYPYHPNSPTSTHISSNPPQPTDIVHCRICERRIGLWSFRSPERCFDLVDEHIAWCPLRERDWWEGSILLEPPGGMIWDGGVKAVLRASERLERKRWRRA